jgi:EmrB/QacA subfamily drug resistance transporter
VPASEDQQTGLSSGDAGPPSGGLRLDSPTGRWVIAATVLGSCMVFLDGTVVNIALPAIGRDFDAGISGLQWIVNGYLLALAALIVLGGSLGDRFGRRRMFVAGTIGFTFASMLCGIAPSTETLIAARLLQGVAGALLTPGSLAIIESSFAREDRGRAIGMWSGLAGASTAFGPPLGGYLIDALSWRAVFFLNVPLGLLVVWIAMRHVPETRGREVSGGSDYSGAALAAIGLGGVSYALIQGPEMGVSAAAVVVAMIGGLIALVGFVIVERRTPDPMLPLGIFRSRPFLAANLITFLVYAGLGGVFFFLIVLLQTALDYSPIEAGLATLPVTIVLLLLSSRAGALSQRIGPRIPLTAGPLLVAASMLMMRSIRADSDYLTGILPSMMVFSFGLVLIVAPVTATALSTAPSEDAGVASAVNNAVSRTGQMLAVAVLPAIAGLTGDEYENPAAILSAFDVSMVVTAAMSIGGAAIAWLMIPDNIFRDDEPESPMNCPIEGTPMTPGRDVELSGA